MDGNDSGAVQYRMSLPPPAQPSPAHTRSPAIAPQAERRGSRVVKGWSKRRVHRWRSPLLMICFFLLGFAMSIAHCVFYPKLRGRVVGDSDQQEEKIRYGSVFGVHVGLRLTCVDSAPPLPFSLKYVLGLVYGRPIRSGCGGR
jgi:hypothetical protein